MTFDKKIEDLRFEPNKINASVLSGSQKVDLGLVITALY
jgi:hypothetical protein